MLEQTTKNWRLLYPGQDGWLVADVTDGGRVEPGSSVDAQLPLKSSRGERLIVALPARLFASVLIPVTAPDAETRDAALQLQMEKLGLLPQQGKAGQSPHASLEAGADGSEHMMLVVLLDEVPQQEICIESAERFEVAPRLLATETGVLSIYRELGSLVAVVPDKAGALAYFQVLGADGLDAASASEIALLLQSVGSLPGMELPGKIHLHFDVSAEGLRFLEVKTGLPVELAGEPCRRLANPPWNLVPPQVTALRAATRRRRAFKMAAMAAALVVLAAVTAMAFHVGSLTVRRDSLRKALEQVAGDVESARATAAAWQQMQLALDPDIYPIERLYLATRTLPPEGVRLTVFEQRGASIVITGEASSTPAAIKFANDLKRSPEWGGYEFEIPQPKILPNNSAQFRITARAPNAAAISVEDVP